MDKLAQERGIFNKIREKANITGKILESLNPEFQDMMEKLRATDGKIRGEAEDIKAIVRAAKSYHNRRDYLSAATNISAFHERCRLISAQLQKFINGVDLKHYKFLLDQFDDEQKQQLFGYDPNKEIGEDELSIDDFIVNDSLEKKAGISDWWFAARDPLADLAHNLTQERGIAMRALEKRFSISFLKELKANTDVMVVRTQKFLQILLSTFKKLAAALARRNVDQYVTSAKAFIAKFADFHQKFVKYYEKSIVPLKEQNNKLIAEQAEQQRLLEQQRQNMERQRAEQEKARLKQHDEDVSALTPKVQPAEEPEENEPISLTKVKSASEFISSLQSFANADDPRSLLMEILAYSQSLEDIDPDASLKLLAIAEGLVEDYKTAGIFDFLNKEKTQPKGEAKVESDPLV